MPPLGAGALANGLKAVIYDKSTGYITGYDNGGTVSNAVTGITSNEKAADGTILLGDTYLPTPMTPRCTLSTRRLKVVHQQHG